MRIGDSMRLMEQSSYLSPEEIAEEVGIPSRSTFYRQFFVGRC